MCAQLLQRQRQLRQQVQIAFGSGGPSQPRQTAVVTQATPIPETGVAPPSGADIGIQAISGLRRRSASLTGLNIPS